MAWSITKWLMQGLLLARNRAGRYPKLWSLWLPKRGNSSKLCIMRNTNQDGEFCTTEDPRDSSGMGISSSLWLIISLLNKVQHPDVRLNKNKGQGVRDKGTETVHPKPRVPPKELQLVCTAASAVSCGSISGHPLFSKPPPAAAFSRHRLLLQFPPFPQAVSPRGARHSTRGSASTCKSSTEAWSSPTYEQGSCDYPARGWLGTEMQRDGVICLKVA